MHHHIYTYIHLDYFLYFLTNSVRGHTLYFCVSPPVSVSEILFLFVSDPVCFRFCLFLFLFLLLGITVGNLICFFVSRDGGAKRRPPPKAVGEALGSQGPPAPGDPSQHLTAGTRMFYALDSRNTNVLCTARANQGRRKQPAGLRNFCFFFFGNVRCFFL